MASPAQKRFQKVRAAREAAAAKEAEKAKKQAEERAEAHAKARAEQKPNPFNGKPPANQAPSPARKHFNRVRAKLEASEATEDRPHGSTYELYHAQLMEHVRALHDIQSVQQKIERKRELLPEYEDYVAGVLEGGNGQQDDVLMNIMVWYLDAGQLGKGLDIAEYAVKHSLETPDRYQRSTAALVSEEVADFVLKERSEGDEPSKYLAEIDRTLELFGEADMHDQIKAKLYKSQGYLLRECEELEEAAEALELALNLDERVGVKKDIQALQKQLKNSGQ